MKKYFMALLLVLPLCVFGQRFELGLNYGPAFFMASSNSYGRVEKLEPALYSSLSLACVAKDYDVTLRIGGNRLQYEYKDNGFNRIVIASSTNEVTLGINTRFTYKQLCFYGGLSGGLLYFVNPDITAMARLYPDAAFAVSDGSGFIAGIQFGANYMVSRRLALSLEWQTMYSKMHVVDNYTANSGYPVFEMDMSYIKMPVAIGIKYHFGIGAKYKYKKKKV